MSNHQLHAPAAFLLARLLFLIIEALFPASFKSSVFNRSLRVAAEDFSCIYWQLFLEGGNRGHASISREASTRSEQQASASSVGKTLPFLLRPTPLARDVGTRRRRRGLRDHPLRLFVAARAAGGSFGTYGLPLGLARSGAGRRMVLLLGGRINPDYTFRVK